MKTSAQLLLFNVEDVLGMAHIRAKKFKKVITEFNLKSCIEEIMSIQHFKAQQQKIQMKAEVRAIFANFDDQTDNLLVSTDEKRFQQILVNL